MESEFSISRPVDSNGNPISTNSLSCIITEAGRIENVVNCILSDSLTGDITARCTPPFTGKYKLTLSHQGNAISEPLDILIEPDGVQPQAVPTGVISAGSVGVLINLDPIVDKKGRRIAYERSDVKTDIAGGPDDCPGYATTTRVKKENNGELSLFFRPVVPGLYYANATLFGYPLLANKLQISIHEDENTPPYLKELPPSSFNNPLCGQVNVFAIPGIADKNGKLLESYMHSELRPVFEGPENQLCKGTVITLRSGITGVEFTPPVDGHYNIQFYHRNEPLLEEKIQLYVGTRELHQQLAFGGQPFEITLDGVAITLLPLTDHNGKQLQYKPEEILIEYGGPESGFGTAEVMSDKKLIFHLNPSKPGEYKAQAFYKNRPILVQDLVFTVVDD